MGRRGYPAEFRGQVLDLVAAGGPVARIAAELGIRDQTICQRRVNIDPLSPLGFQWWSHQLPAPVRRGIS